MFVESIKEGDHCPEKSAIKHSFSWGVILILGELNEFSHSRTGFANKLIQNPPIVVLSTLYCIFLLRTSLLYKVKITIQLIRTFKYAVQRSY